MFASTCSSSISMCDCVCVRWHSASTCDYLNPLRRKPQLRNGLDEAGLWVIVFTAD